MTNKDLYNKILNGDIPSQESDNVESLGYPIVDSVETNAYLGSNALLKTAWCEDTVDVPNSSHFSASVLIIGGGGGGGSGQGGGGGGGGYREFTKKFFTGTNYTVTIGAGGSANSNGSNSNIERIADGGGAGGNAWGSTQEACNGKDGGSGGGTGLTSNTSFRNTYGGNSLDTRCNGSSQGYPAQPGPGPILSSGGAGGTGSSQNGGPGKTSNITGTSVGRGGGGACGFGSGTATDGGGAPYTPGTVNTGGGGGGGGANGGSGFVVLKFPDSYSITIGGGLTYTSSTSGGYTTVQFTAGTDTIEFFWNPASISGLELWLDANDAETITLNGSTVSQWNDKSGNNYDVSQSTASEQPVYQSAALNSRNVVRFDGINDGLLNTVDTPVGGSTNRTIFVVFNFTAFIGPKYALTLGYNGGPFGTAFGISQEIGVRVGDGNRVFNTSVDTTHAIVTIMLDGTSTSDLSAWKNGSSLGVSSTVVRTLNTSSGIGVGRSSGGANIQGDVAEIIVYNSALSTSDKESVEDYLSRKWGIS